MKTNLLKSIFISLIFVMGVSNAWAHNLAANQYVYFEKPSDWTQVALLLGHDSYSIGYNMTKISNTNLYYWKTASWGGYNAYAFIDAKDWGGEGNGSSSKPDTRKKWATHYSSTLTTAIAKCHLFNSTKSIKSSTTSTTAYATVVNRTQTIKVQLKDGSNWVDATVVPADLKASTYALTSSTAAGEKSASLAKESTTVSATVDAAYSATVSLSCTNVLDGYMFEGWYDANGNTITSYTVSDAHTVYARFIQSAEETNEVSVTYMCDATEVSPAIAEIVGVETEKSFTAPTVTGYKFTNWTVGDGMTLIAGTTANDEKITVVTKSASSDYTLVANYKEVIETIYFINTNKWARVNIHKWNGKAAASSWPGEKLTASGEKIGEYDVYAYTAKQGDYANVIFNSKTSSTDGGNAQTGDLEWTAGKYYIYNYGGKSGWYTKAEAEELLVVPVVTHDIVVKAVAPEVWNSGTISIHYWGDGISAPSKPVATEKDGNWNKYTIKNVPEGTSVNVIFINGTDWNGNANQTANITGITEDKCFQISAKNKDGEGKCTVKEVDCDADITPEGDDYYTVVGVAELFGEAWATKNEANKMAKQGDGSYKLVKENVTLAAIGYDWKIAKNGDWWNDAATGVNPSGGKNNTLTIKTPGRYNVTFTLSANLQTATAETELLEEIIVIPDCYISGNATLTGGEGWQGNEFTMVYNEETETWTYTLAGLQPEKEYELKVVCGGTWYSFENLVTPVPTGITEGNDHAIAFQMEEAGDVVVTYNKTKGITIDGNFVKFINVYLAGDMTNWGEGQLQFRKKAADDKVATVTVELTEGEHKFKIIEDGKWLGNNGTMTREYHENWIFRAKQDDGTNDEVDATIYADENGIYTFTWNSDRNELTVTYPAPTEKYIYFKNNPGWNKVYVYFFQKDNFNDKGAIISTGLTVVGAMTQVGTSDIWQYEYGTAGLPLSGVIAFTETLQENKSNFSNTKAAYRTDFNKNMELFIPQKTSNETKNNTDYYSTGLWMKYNSIESGYVFANNIDDDWQEDSLVADAPGGYHFDTRVALSENTTYNFKIKNIKGDWFGQKSTTMTSTNTNVELEVGAGDEYNVQLTTTSPGFYIISIDLAAGKMMVNIEYPLLTGDYRMVYVERLGQEYTKFHPAQSIRYQAKGEKKDTISFYINKSNNPAILLQRCTNINGDTITWTDVAIQNINGIGGAAPVAALAPAKRAGELYIGTGSVDVTKNGVYNFTLGQTDGNATILNEETHPYTGDYYIRTNAADGGWRKYNTNPDNIMTHSQTALKQVGGYDYYFCKWVLKDQSVQYVVANDYSYCVSDTLTTDSIVTNVNGILPANANVRYTWNSSTNELARAYLAGSGNIADRYLVLIGDANLKDTSGKNFNVSGLKDNEVAFEDMGNWLYQLDVKANPHTQVKLTADYNEKTQYFIGSADTTKQLIKGNDTTHYALRLIYDFKTNYLVSGLVGNQTITGNLKLEEVMIVRSHHDEAQTLKISDTGSVTANKAYGVMTFNKDTLNDNTKSQYERALYWVSFPFNVKLDEAFGFGNYGEHWIMEYYDGAERAEKGLWKEPTYSYWKFIEDPKGYILEAGQGYVLCLDLDLLGNNAEFWKHDNTEIALYFPSNGKDTIVINNQATVRETIVPEHECTIDRDDRKNKDSNWNIIGVPAYTKIAKMVGENIFYYQYNAAKDSFALSNTPNFNTMHAYMVQFAGTINWTEQATSIAALAARKSPTSKDQYTLRLALQQEGADHDHTFIRLQEDNATAEFDMNYDLCKIINRGANIYSMINDVEVAANVLPMEERVIPLGLDIAETGNYTFAMPDGTDGITAILIDYETGKETNLLLADYTTELREGTNNERFALRVRPNHVATAVETIIDGANGQIQKYIINGALYILNKGQLYDAQGRMVQP